MKVWVTRDSDSNQMYENIHVWNCKPEKDRGVYMPLEGNDGWQVNKHAFKIMSGFTPRKGSCKRYELTLKEIE